MVVLSGLEKWRKSPYPTQCLAQGSERRKIEQFPPGLHETKSNRKNRHGIAGRLLICLHKNERRYNNMCTARRRQRPYVKCETRPFFSLNWKKEKNASSLFFLIFPVNIYARKTKRQRLWTFILHSVREVVRERGPHSYFVLLLYSIGK